MEETENKSIVAELFKGKSTKHLVLFTTLPKQTVEKTHNLAQIVMSGRVTAQCSVNSIKFEVEQN